MEKYEWNKVMKYLVSGAAGFIGFNTCLKLLKNSENFVFGIDNLNNYYSTKLKRDRLKILNKFNNFKFKKSDLIKQDNLNNLFKKNKFDIVINLAAQAGVRHSLENPRDYFNSNLLGFFNIIEASQKYGVKNFLFASTSSVYGESQKKILKEENIANHPIQFYAATKKSNEAIAHSFSHVYGMQTIGLRFFTVYGPWGRPDMVLYKFVSNIINSKKIELYNFGNHYRDFTYIDDVTNIILKLSKLKIKKQRNLNKINSGTSKVNFEIFNVSSGRKVHLIKFLKLIEKYLNKKAKIKNLPMQKGDVYQTISSRKKLGKFIKLSKSKKIDYGILKFINWYKEYFKIK
jgi:UDP-glucuronate 4-epimerase